MAMKLYPDTAVQAIANAIRAKNGSNSTYSIGEMAAAINAIPTGGSSKNIQFSNEIGSVRTTSYSDTGVSLIVEKSGTYDVYWTAWRNTNSGTNGSRLYRNGSAVGTAHTSFTGTYGQQVHETLTLSEGDNIAVYGRARNTSYYLYACNLLIIEQ